MQQSSDNLTDAFVARINAAIQKNPTTADREAVRHCLVDFIGVTLAGAAQQREEAMRLIHQLNPDGGTVPVMGLGTHASLTTAALVTGMSAHTAELDDGERFAMVHPGAPVLGALIPLASVHAFDGDALYRAVLAGYEVTIRMARTMQPALKKRGYHATGICGTLGAAWAVATALNYSGQEQKNALAAAAASTAGTLKAIRDHSALKPYNAGMAAMNGLVAALTARAGYAGPDDPLGGVEGLLRQLVGSDAKTQELLPDAESLPAIHAVYRKPYAACRHCHPAIEAAIDIRSRHALNHSDVQSVTVHTYALGIPGHDHRQIAGSHSAKMSTPYSVAAALVWGKAGQQEFAEPALSNTHVKRITQLTRVLADDEMSRAVPRERAAEVRVQTTNGSEHVVRINLPLGEPERPLSTEAIEAKFRELATDWGMAETTCNEVLEIAARPGEGWHKQLPLLLFAPKA
ncbi:MAG: MmgE/PrpD family protein [Cryomorphaceae bacterium]|nr:MAG: MmgE/PrpD family protein [Cryomorphaceae bacterium]